LDVPLCDACYPKARPEAPLVAVKTRTSTRSKRSAVGPIEDMSGQRLFHLTHVSNLPAILAERGLLADADAVVDISAPAARETRRTIAVSDDGETVASFVPFFLAPETDVWDAIRFGTPDPRLNVPADAVASDFVLLVTAISNLVGSSVVVADGDATHPLTRFEMTPDAADRALRRLKLDDESGRIRAAEYLVKDRVDFEAITLIAVANDKAKNAVRALVDPAGYRTRIAIHPPWFARTPE
jgi:hypothetical protein